MGERAAGVGYQRSGVPRSRSAPEPSPVKSKTAAYVLLLCLLQDVYSWQGPVTVVRTGYLRQ